MQNDNILVAASPCPPGKRRERRVRCCLKWHVSIVNMMFFRSVNQLTHVVFYLFNTVYVAVCVRGLFWPAVSTAELTCCILVLSAVIGYLMYGWLAVSGPVHLNDIWSISMKKTTSFFSHLLNGLFALSALTLLVGWQEGRPACKTQCTDVLMGVIFARCQSSSSHHRHLHHLLLP